MIRLLFVLFVTLGGFVAAAVWNFRSDDVVERVVSPELRASVAEKVEGLGLPKLAEKLPIPKRTVTTAPVDPKPEPQPARASEPEGAAPAVVASSTAKPSASAASDAPRALDESPHSGAGGSVAPNDASIEHVTEVEVIVPRAEFARDLGPASDRGMETANDALAVDETASALRPDWDDDSLNHDADRSAKLIRRMLAVYRSSGSGR
jgi:hypothetical protein